MKHKIFSIHDQKAKAYLPPIILHAEGMAIRTFSDCVNDPDHAFSKHPEDYTLFNLGAFDDSTGELIPNPPISIHNGVELIQTNVTEIFPEEKQA